MSYGQVSHYAQYEDVSHGRVGGITERHSVDVERSRVHAEMHLGVYTALFGCWAVFFSLFWMTFLSSPQTVFLIGFITIFAVIGFGVTVVMNRMGKYLPGTTGTLTDFLKGRVATADGSVKGSEALIQVILVPACLTVGGVAIGLIIIASRFSY